MCQFRAHVENGFCNSDQKSMLMVGFLTCNDSDILRAKTGPYRRVGYQTNIPPTPHLPPPLCSNSKAYSCNLYNYIAPTLRLTMDQYQTCLDLVPTPRATVCIPFLHLSYLPDPFSLTITGNYSFLV